MKRLLSAMVFAILCFTPITSVGQQPVKEKYEPVSTSEFNVSMELSGGVRWDEYGKANGGPIKSLSFWGHELKLTSNMIKDGFIHTKDYGKIKIVPNPNFTFHMELTPSQKKKLKKLKKRAGKGE